METPSFEPTPTAPEPLDDAPQIDPLAALWRRWFVEYNPAYLASAALILVGLTLVSREATSRGSVVGALGVAAVAELYALALIGGAAFLTRVGQRRAAVMLALLAVLYQGDLTLHVETCAYLGALGALASLAWLLVFVAKLAALCAALALRPSRGAWLAPILGAVGLAALPHVSRAVEPATRAELLASWIFLVGAAALFTRREVRSAVGFDARGRRALAATWMLWAALGLAHALYWAGTFGVSIVPAIAAGGLLVAARRRDERALWLGAVGALGAVAHFAPAALPITSLLTAASLALRALRAPTVDVPMTPAVVSPYRDARPPAAPPATLGFAPAPRPAAQRLWVGVAVNLYLSLSLWLSPLRFVHGHWLLPDIALLVAAAIAAWRWRRALPLAPALAAWGHLALTRGWIGRGALEQGVLAVLAGFALLALGLVTSWRARPRAGGACGRSSAPP